MNICKKMSMILMAFSSSLYVITTSAVSRHAEESSQQSARELQRSRHTDDYLLMTPRQIQDDWNKGLLIETIQKATNHLSQSLSQLKTDSLDHCQDDDISQSLESLHGMISVHSHDKSIQTPLKIIHHFRSFENFLNKINSELSNHQSDFIQNDAQHKNPALCIKAIHESLAATSRELTYLFEWLAQDNEHSLSSNEHKNMVRDLLNKDKKDLNIYSFLETLTNQYETEKNHADGVLSDYNNHYWHLENNVMVSFRSENIPSHRSAGEEGREITTIDDGRLADYKASIAKTLFAFQDKVPVIQKELSNLHAHLNNIA